MKTAINFKDEFQVGKHKIGWMNSRFTDHFSGDKFEACSTPTFQKLPRGMSDATIEHELKPGMCGPADILAFLDNAPEECKDGYANLFYTPAFVVSVRWVSFGGGWYVDTWDRDGHEWLGGSRVFSPATDRSVAKNSSETLNLGDDPSAEKIISKAIEIVKAAGYQVAKIL